MLQTQNIFDLISQTEKEITSGAWLSFLRTAGWNYKYNFPCQVLIFAQQPAATACASMEEWNTKLQRQVKENAHGIAILKDRGDELVLQYIYDVSETFSPTGKGIPLWHMRPEQKTFVHNELFNTFYPNSSMPAWPDDTGFYRAAAATILAADQQAFTQRVQDIRLCSDALSRMPYAESFRIIRDLLINSMACAMMYRCGLEPDIDTTVFADVNQYLTGRTLAFFGQTMQYYTKQGLDIAAKAVKSWNITHKEEQSHVEHHISEIRGISDPQSDITGAAEPEQVRPVAEDLSAGAETGRVHASSDERRTADASGARGDGHRTDGTGDDGISSADEPGTQEESRQPGMGAAHVQSAPSSGRTGLSGDGIRITEEETYPSAEEHGLMPELPSPEEQAATVLAAKDVFNLSQDEINHCLLYPLSKENTHARLDRFFSENPAGADTASQIRELYSTDLTELTFPDGTKGAYYAKSMGLYFFRMDEDDTLNLCGRVSWKEAVSMLRQFYASGYFTTKEDEAPTPSSVEELEAGQTISLSGKQYYILRMSTESVLLQDVQNPLFTQEMPRNILNIVLQNAISSNAGKEDMLYTESIAKEDLEASDPTSEQADSEVLTVSEPTSEVEEMDFFSQHFDLKKAKLNYYWLEQYAPEIMSGTLDYMRFESDVFEPLYIERIAEDQLAIAHTFTQNGDLMRDPEITFHISEDKKALYPLTYEQSDMAIYQRVLKEGENAEVIVDHSLEHATNGFFSIWMQNLQHQGHIPVRGTKYTREGDLEYTFSEDRTLVLKQEENEKPMLSQEQQELRTLSGLYVGDVYSRDGAEYQIHSFEDGNVIMFSLDDGTLADPIPVDFMLQAIRTDPDARLTHFWARPDYQPEREDQALLAKLLNHFDKWRTSRDVIIPGSQAYRNIMERIGRLGVSEDAEENRRAIMYAAYTIHHFFPRPDFTSARAHDTGHFLTEADNFLDTDEDIEALGVPFRLREWQEGGEHALFTDLRSLFRAPYANPALMDLPLPSEDLTDTDRTEAIRMLSAALNEHLPESFPTWVEDAAYFGTLGLAEQYLKDLPALYPEHSKEEQHHSEPLIDHPELIRRDLSRDARRDKVILADLMLHYANYRMTYNLQMPSLSKSDEEAYNMQRLALDDLVVSDDLSTNIETMDQYLTFFRRWFLPFADLVKEDVRYELNALLYTAENFIPEQGKEVSQAPSESVAPYESEASEDPAEENTIGSENIRDVKASYITEILRCDKNVEYTWQETTTFFRSHTELSERISYLQKRYGDVYTMFFAEDKETIGFHGTEEGLEIWEGSYLTAPARNHYTWQHVCGLIEQEIDKDLAQDPYLYDQEPSLFDFSFEEETQKQEAPLNEPIVPFAQEEIDHFLMLGSNTANSRMKIATEFMKQKPASEIAAFLKETYIGGYGITENGRNISAWYAEDGIHLAMGQTARDNKSAQIIPWTKAAERIGQLLSTGKFATKTELAEAPEYERNQLAESLWHLHGDLSEKGRKGDYLNILSRDKFGNFTDGTKYLTERLTDPQFCSILTQQYAEFLDAYRQDRSIMRFNFYKFDRIMAELEELEHPRREYQSELIDMAAIDSFITDDEINAELATGRGIDGGKARIYEYFQKPHSHAERADFLKQEYGTGGHSHALSGADYSSVNYDAKGLRYEKGDCDGVNLSWSQVAARVNDLIKLDRYMTPEDMAQRQAIPDAKAETDAEPERAIPTPVQASPATESDARINYHVTDKAPHYGGPKARYENNIAAIRLLKQIEAEERLATAEEQEILQKYVGWGGLSEAFDKTSASWQQEYAELKELLTEDEYISARASTSTAFYTPPVVTEAIYDALRNFGFRRGNILDPCCGIGAFFGSLPEDMQHAKLHGIELDSISGRIARQLYQQANIIIDGYEKVNIPDSLYDIAVGNVPFGDFGVFDKRYNKEHFLIHDYFFAKTLDKVRPGGIVAFITSKGTMDKQNESVRRYIAQRADLLGAIRLPDTTFKTNAGTDVVADILFLQKRDHPTIETPDWVGLDSAYDYATGTWGPDINRYFVEHPEMILGDMTEVSGPHGPVWTCKAREGESLKDALKNAVANISGQLNLTVDDLEVEETTEKQTLPADPDVRNFSFTLVDGTVYYRTDSVMHPVELKKATEQRVRGLIELRDIVHELIAAQVNGLPDQDIFALQQKLNDAYDAFTQKHGLINSRGNSMAFSDDSAYYLLCSLEHVDDEGNFKGKADIFFKRTIGAHKEITSTETAREALAVSMGERARVDLDYMSQLCGMSKEEMIADLAGLIFPVPDSEGTYEISSIYLSGNIREKLADAKRAAKTDPRYEGNIVALEAAMPEPLTPDLIAARLGSPWIPAEDITDFIHELFEPRWYKKDQICALHSEYNNTWCIKNRTWDDWNHKAKTTYGTERANGYKLLEDALNGRDTQVFDTVTVDGKDKRVLNMADTMEAQEKQRLIREAFTEWIWRDPVRRDRLCAIYNERYNSIVPPSYDGDLVTFHGMNPLIQLEPHQKECVARILYGGNTQLAHEVGAGKTWTMVAAAMEGKHLGLCNKSMIIVPNHLVGQWAAAIYELYPAANVLASTNKDFETRNRKKFCSRIATGDYDIVVLGHSQFEKIPLSQERQERNLQLQIDEVLDAIAQLKEEHAERFTIKQVESVKKNLEVRLNKLLNSKQRDDVVSFEELGVDRLFVDESHEFKNLFLYTKMRNVAGIAQTDAQKASDLFMKCRYMDELTGNMGNIHATGTPISNTMAELYTTQRYLQYDLLQKMGLGSFDAWAGSFGETVQAYELAPEGQGFRQRTRFAKFFNVPELMNIYKLVADIRTKEVLNLPVPTPHYKTVAVPASDIQKEYVKTFCDRAKRIRNGGVNQAKDNMLCITNDGRKLALDQRLMDSNLPDNPQSKANACADEIMRYYKEGEEEKLTQLVFCDLSTPKGNGEFNVYDDLKEKLIARGIPENEIRFIHEAKNDAQKEALFAKVRSGEVRVLMGSTGKMGTGTNVQDRLIAGHDLDCPYRPSDLEQRAGRVIRRGNGNDDVFITRYVTEGTFDGYMYQLLKSKQRFASQIFTNKQPSREVADMDEVTLSYAEIMALATGSPKIMEKVELEAEVARLKILKSRYDSEQYHLDQNIRHKLPDEIEKTQKRIIKLTEDTARIKANPRKDDGERSICIVKGKTYETQDETGEVLIQALKNVPKDGAHHTIATLRGFEIQGCYEPFLFDPSRGNYNLSISGSLRYPVDYGPSGKGNMQRLNNELDKIPESLEKSKHHLATLELELASAKADYGKPFHSQALLDEKTARLKVLEEELDMDLQEKEAQRDRLPSLDEQIVSASKQNGNFVASQHAERERSEGMHL